MRWLPPTLKQDRRAFPNKGGIRGQHIDDDFEVRRVSGLQQRGAERNHGFAFLYDFENLAIDGRSDRKALCALIFTTTPQGRTSLFEHMLGHVPSQFGGGGVTLGKLECERIAVKLRCSCNAAFSQLGGALKINAGTLQQNLGALSQSDRFVQCRLGGPEALLKLLPDAGIEQRCDVGRDRRQGLADLD